ncbi:HlyD family efflux transporter periplasmic adaptor subunit [Pedobacter hiemivivus]|uniref:HlyD family efflux transporter periplasmic adaptor subunit n=1 Tax=Pedobacter hiemivivus TaxID=2530454 RepID=A0A4U1FZF9_9SPHI|nr:HlyD family efflux transporter periplasmic adaptor subunit [Pedobacter hiemivivus]TKC56555.1 HlyD family efflux transporter periplasmic adaptor subunit [Pedobacter hiemivivus]
METAIENIKETDKRINSLEVNSEEVQEIITAVPSWILRRGITLVFGILLAIVLVSAFIQYPDVVKTSLKVNSLNAPKAVFVKQTGKLLNLLAAEGTTVKQYEPLAFMESTANHKDVLKLQGILTHIIQELSVTSVAPNLLVKGLNLGELQGAYQNFYQQYLQYVSAQNGGYYLNRKQYLERDLKDIEKLKAQIIGQQKIQEMEFANMEHEFEAYKKLYLKNMVSISEYKQQENKYLAGKYPLQQSITALLNNNTSYAAKQKEILELEHTIQDERAKFVQSLSNMLTETDAWVNQYILRAPVDGKISYAGIVQENQTLNVGQEVFMVNPANTDFFGEVYIPQYNMGKVKTGQRTLVKMRSFPFEQYGLIRGRVNYISDVAFKDSVFIAKISFERFENKDPEHGIVLKNGMQADAEIITEESSLLQRFIRNITKMLNSTN